MPGGSAARNQRESPYKKKLALAWVSLYAPQLGGIFRYTPMGGGLAPWLQRISKNAHKPARLLAHSRAS